MKLQRFSKVAFVVVFAAALAVGTVALAAKKPRPPGGGTCPKDILCLDVWDPVQCADGVIYSNSCYATRACAPGPCVSVGGTVSAR